MICRLIGPAAASIDRNRVNVSYLTAISSLCSRNEQLVAQQWVNSKVKSEEHEDILQPKTIKKNKTKQHQNSIPKLFTTAHVIIRRCFSHGGLDGVVHRARKFSRNRSRRGRPHHRKMLLWKGNNHSQRMTHWEQKCSSARDGRVSTLQWQFNTMHFVTE